MRRTQLPFCCVSASTTELDACTVDPGLADSLPSSSGRGPAPPWPPWGWASMLAVSILRAASSCCHCWAAFSAATVRASALRFSWFKRCTSTLKADTCAQGGGQEGGLRGMGEKKGARGLGGGGVLRVRRGVKGRKELHGPVGHCSLPAPQHTTNHND